MSRTYHWRLPQSMGGRVVAGVLCGFVDGEFTQVEIEVDGQTHRLPRDLFIAIKRPQPMAGWVVTSGDKPQVFHRKVDFDIDMWWHHDQNEFITWDAICEYGEPMEMVALKGRARCAVCHEVKLVRLDGMIKEHGSRSVESRCKGSGMPPEGAS